MEGGHERRTEKGDIQEAVKGIFHRITVFKDQEHNGFPRPATFLARLLLVLPVAEDNVIASAVVDTIRLLSLPLWRVASSYVLDSRVSTSVARWHGPLIPHDAGRDTPAYLPVSLAVFE